MTEEVQLVWTGPSSATVSVRSMAAVLEDLIAEATSDLIIMTYSARRYEPVRAALAAALQRKVRVDVVVERSPVLAPLCPVVSPLRHSPGYPD